MQAWISPRHCATPIPSSNAAFAAWKHWPRRPAKSSMANRWPSRTRCGTRPRPRNAEAALSCGCSRASAMCPRTPSRAGHESQPIEKHRNARVAGLASQLLPVRGHCFHMPEKIMRKPILILACASMLVLSFTALGAEQCRYSAPRNAEINAAGLKLLTVQIGPDDLVIHGDPGVTSVVVRGTACASNEKWLQDVKIEASRSGDTGSLIAHDGDHTMLMSLFGGSYAYLKLDVRVPQSLAIKLQEGSGDARVNNVAALDASVGSGDLKVDGVAGAFGLSVGSGDVVANDAGSFDLSSLGSGDVSMDGVRGNARTGGVGSGDLVLGNVKGEVS